MGELKQHQPSMTIDEQVENLKSLAGELIQNADLTEHIISDLVDVTIKDQEKKVKLFNWIVAITVALIYVAVSLITMKWEITWIIWVVYCIYRISTEFVIKKR